MFYIDIMLDIQEVMRRLISYLIEGLAVAVVAYLIPRGRKLNMDEIVVIGVTAAATFAILDMWTPRIGNAARMGAGFGIGGNIAGFPGHNVMG
jgi:hypothetical protein